MPLDAQQLNDVYDLGVNQNGPGPGTGTAAKAPKPAPIFDLKNLGQQASPVNVGAAKPVDVEDYGNYLTNGVYSDQDIDQQRADHQGIINKLGHALGNLPGDIIGSLATGIGDLGLLASQWGDERTYHNALTDFGDFAKNSTRIFGGTGQVYEGHHETLGQTLSDPGWWINQTEGLANFAISYAALGAGVAGTIGKMAEGATTALRAGELATRIGQGLGQVSTAGMMAYTMGAQSASQVFKDTYETQFQKMIDAGQDPEDAKKNATHIAAQSAATTVQLTTAIGTILGAASMAPYFRSSEDVAMDILKKKVPQQVGESVEEWGNRVKALNPADYGSILNPSHSMLHKLSEAGKMGVEMQQLQFGQKTGEELGKKGKTEGFLDQFQELNNYFDRTMDKDGMLQFAIGAVSGIGIDYLRNNVIPSRWADKIDPTTGEPIPKVDNDGKVIGNERKLYTPKVFNERFTAAKFSSMRDAIASDIEQYGSKQQSYLAAVKAGDQPAIDRAATEMFNINNVNGIITGMGDIWKQTYEGISNMSGEEAVQKGYTTDPNDLSFQERASKAAKNMDRYQKIYDDLNKRYGTQYDVNQGFKPVVDGLFARKVHLDAWDELLKEHEAKLKDINSLEDARLSITDPEMFSQHEGEYARTWETATKSIEKLRRDKKTMSDLIDQYNDAIDKNTNTNNIGQKMSALAREYSALDPEADNSAEGLTKSIQATIKRIDETITKHGERVKQAEDNLFNSSGYTDWSAKHEGETFRDYMDKIRSNLDVTEYDHQVDLARAKYDIAKKNIAEIEKEKNLVRFSNKYSKYMEDEVKQAEAIDKSQNGELANRAKAEVAYQKLRDAQMNEMADRYKKAADGFRKEVGDERGRLEDAKKELAGMVKKDIVKKLGLQGQIRRIERNIAKLNAKIKKYDTLEGDHRVLTSPEPDLVDTNTITVNPDTGEGQTTNEVADQQESDLPKVNEINNDVQEVVEEVGKAAEQELFSRQMEVDKAEHSLIEALTPHLDLYDVMDVINNIQTTVLEGGSFSYDMLRNEVSKGLMTQEAANNVLQSLKDYADALQRGYDTSDLHGFNETNVELANSEPEPAVEIIDTDPPSDIPVADIGVGGEPPEDAYKAPEDDGQGNVTFGGAKTVEANTIANSTLLYNELTPDHNNEINLASNPRWQNPATNPAVLKGNQLYPGTSIQFVVDTEYDGPKIVSGQSRDAKQERESFSDYSDENGKVPANKMANVPIKIVDTKTGKTIGYVRKHDWVTERVDGRLRNIAEKFDSTTGEETNGAKQAQKILDIRKQIVDQFNADGRPINGKTNSKGVGHPILNTPGKEGKIKPGFAFNNKDGGLLPDSKLQIAINDKGTLKAGQGYPFDKNIAGETKGLLDGGIFAMLPGANGQHIPVPLIGRGLGENETNFNTIKRAIELYLSYTGSEEQAQTHEVRTLADRVGFDVSKSQGLRNFINQYFTYSQRFDDSATISKGGQSKFLFNIWDNIQGKESKAWIKAGWSESGMKPIHAGLDSNGELNKDFQQVLKDGLATRSKAVTFTRDGIRGINEPRKEDNPFVTAIYTKDKNGQGKWVHNEYKDYNEYVKAFSKTTAFGKNKLADGTHVYTANPSIGYDLDAAKLNEQSPMKIVVENKKAEVNLQKQDSPSSPTSDRYTNLLSQFNKFMDNPTEEVAEKLGKEFINDPRLNKEGWLPDEWLKSTNKGVSDASALMNRAFSTRGAELLQGLEKLSKEEEGSTTRYDVNLANEMDDIFNGASLREEHITAIGTGPEKSKELNLKNLEDLYNFTPEDQRNGKTPADMLRELSDRGHNFIPDGYNPFSLCL